MNTKIIAVALVGILAVAGAGIYFANQQFKDSEEDSRGTITVTDIRGKEVEVKYPVERVVITAHQMLDFYVGVYGTGFEKLLVAYPTDFVADPTREAAYLAKYPSLKNLPEFPDLLYQTSADFPDELCAGLKADVVLVPKILMESKQHTEESYKLTTASGAAVVWMDVVTNIYGETPAGKGVLRENIEILGKLFGKEERADRLSSALEAEMKKVTDKISEIPANLKNSKIYYEFMALPDGNKYGLTIGGPNTPEANFCCAINRADEIGFGNGGYANLEQIADIRSEDGTLIRTQVDHVIIFPLNMFGNTEDASLFGYGKTVDVQKLEKAQKQYVERVGWGAEEFEASKNHKMWFFVPTLRQNLIGFASIQFLAKILYPDYFENLDVGENIKNICREYDMPFSGEGVFLYQFTLPASK